MVEWGGWIVEKNLHYSLAAKLDRLALYMEKMKLAEYVHLLENIPRLLWINFISGLARGLGMAVGFTLLGALVVYILTKMVNLPLIGAFVAEIVRIVQYQLGV